MQFTSLGRLFTLTDDLKLKKREKARGALDFDKYKRKKNDT